MSKFHVARDEDRALFLYTEKPSRGNGIWLHEYDKEALEIPSWLFSEVSWEDEEPIEVEIIIKQKVEKPMQDNQKYIDREQCRYEIAKSMMAELKKGGEK